MASSVDVLTREDARGGGVLRLPEIREQYERAPEPKEFVILEGSAHTLFIFVQSTDARQEQIAATGHPVT